jgi:hypothetical protein
MNSKSRPVLVLLLLALAVPKGSAACIDAGIEKLYLQENAAGLIAQVSALEAKANRSRGDVVLLGLAAYRAADLKLLKRDEDAAAAVLKTAADVLETQLKKGRDAELGALLALIYGQQIRISPLKGMWLGSDADEALEAAIAAEPNNPRPHLAAGLNVLYKPSGFGGGANKAVSQLQRAVALYAAAKPAADGACWGADDAALALARAKLKLGDRVAAIALVESVLARTPDRRPAQRLLAGIRRGASKREAGR